MNYELKLNFNIYNFNHFAEIPKITNYLINEPLNQINISFGIDCSNALENSIYLFLLSNRQNKCFYQVIFLCEDCSYKFIEVILFGGHRHLYFTNN